MHELEQHAVGIAMHDPFDRAVGIVADRIGGFFRAPHKLRRIGNELAGDRIARIGRVDQRDHIRRQRYRIARRNLLQLGQPRRGSQSFCNQRSRTTQRLFGDP